MAKYTNSPDHIPGFKAQRSVVGSYVGSDNAKTSPLDDDQLMSSGKDSTYDYSEYAHGKKTK
jgi:hypothetical protein